MLYINKKIIFKLFQLFKWYKKFIVDYEAKKNPLLLKVTYSIVNGESDPKCMKVHKIITGQVQLFNDIMNFWWRWN